MKAIKVFILIILFLYVSNQVPEGYAINSCGKLGYQMPNNKNDCEQPNEFCCFVYIQNKTDNSKNKRFCASAPTKILKSDIEKEILEYTDYKLVELECNNSIFLKIDILFVFFFCFILK